MSKEICCHHVMNVQKNFFRKHTPIQIAIISSHFSKITTVKGIQFEPSCAGNLHFLGLIIIL